MSLYAQIAEEKLRAILGRGILRGQPIQKWEASGHIIIRIYDFDTLYFGDQRVVADGGSVTVEVNGETVVDGEYGGCDYEISPTKIISFSVDVNSTREAIYEFEGTIEGTPGPIEEEEGW